MITGAHVMIYSTDADADRAVLKDVLGLPHVDVGHGWLIFALPASEAAVHPSASYSHEMYLMTDDLDAALAKLSAAGLACSEPATQGWGRTTRIRLPGGGDLGLYQSRHARP